METLGAIVVAQLKSAKGRDARQKQWAEFESSKNGVTLSETDRFFCRQFCGAQVAGSKFGKAVSHLVGADTDKGATLCLAVGV